jgi:hypothetical protein
MTKLFLAILVGLVFAVSSAIVVSLATKPAMADAAES